MLNSEKSNGPLPLTDRHGLRLRQTPFQTIPIILFVYGNMFFSTFLLVRKFVCSGFLSRFWGAANLWTPPAACLHDFALDAPIIGSVQPLRLILP